MTGNKTQWTKVSVSAYLQKIEDMQQQADSILLVERMSKATGQGSVMLGHSMIGFGEHHYRHATGREGDLFNIESSPRKRAWVLHGLDIHAWSAEGVIAIGKI